MLIVCLFLSMLFLSVNFKERLKTRESLEKSVEGFFRQNQFFEKKIKIISFLKRNLTSDYCAVPAV